MKKRQKFSVIEEEEGNPGQDARELMREIFNQMEIWDERLKAHLILCQAHGQDEHIISFYGAVGCEGDDFITHLGSCINLPFAMECVKTIVNNGGDSYDQH